MAPKSPPDRRAYQAAWYLTNRANHRARANAYYQKHRAAIIAARRAYRRTAAGMLTESRHSARQRGTR